MSRIQSIQSLEILDSRGNPTLQTKVILDTGECGIAAVPSGASTGSKEALELRDNDKNRYLGKGVMNAVSIVNQQISEVLKGFDIQDQQKIDDTLLQLDGTPNKANLGANSILSVSLAVASAAAQSLKLPLYRYLNETKEFILPLPMMNIINGGVHADNNLDIQEFMILPVGAKNFSECIRYGVEVFHQLKNILREKSYMTAVGDEGGFAPNLSKNADALEIILQAIERAGYKPGQDIFLALDVASNEFYKNGIYHLEAENKILTSEEFVEYLAKLVAQYPILSIEDGMAENDWAGWKMLTSRLGKKIQLVGDDLFVTQTQWLKKGISESAANAILIKPNQTGTLTETMNAIKMAKKAYYNTIISHRSGETEDTFIADLAVGTGAGQIKTGSLCRSDRVAKYNRLISIEHELGSEGRFAGFSFFHQFISDSVETTL